MSKEIENSIIYWDNYYKNYVIDKNQIDDWLDIFKDIILNCNTPILDLGGGSGNNIVYLSKLNKDVIVCDISLTAIENIRNSFPDIYDTKCFNMLDGLPFSDNSFDIVIADLSIHYFKEEDTIKIIKDIKRVLSMDGYLIIRVNSINDYNHGAGNGLEVEKHLYMTNDNRLKRFFDEDDIRYYFKDFDIEYLNEELMDRYKYQKKLYKVCLHNRNL